MNKSNRGGSLPGFDALPCRAGETKKRSARFISMKFKRKSRRPDALRAIRPLMTEHEHGNHATVNAHNR